MRRLLAAAVIALVCLLASRAEALPAATWVVAIGNNHGNAGEGALLYAERDAQELASVLRQQGGVASERLRILADEDAGAARRAVLDASQAIRAVSNTGASTALVVFYSGHADASSLHLRGTDLPLDELRAIVQSSAASTRILVVDACRSGTVTRVKGATPAETFDIKLEDRLEGEGSAIVTSSAAGEQSQEADRLRASFFTHHLVNALRGAADQNGDGRVTLGEAYAYTYRETVRSSSATLQVQHPTFAYDLRGRADVVMTTPGAVGRRSGRLRLAKAASYVIAEGSESGPIVAEVATPRDNAILALPAGRYFVQQREAGEYREYTLTLDADRETSLDATPSRTLKYDALVRKGGDPRGAVHGLTLLGAARGAVVAGEAALPGIVIGYGVDFSSLSLSLRLGAATTTMLSKDPGISARRNELAASALLQRFVDLRAVTLGVGAFAGVLQSLQTFDAPGRSAGTRSAVGAQLGAVLIGERKLYEGLSLRLEAGPMTVILPRARIVDGREGPRDVTASLTWWLGGGLSWRL